MEFTQPVSFGEAMAASRARGLLPTSLTSKQLSGLLPEFRERSRFSAQTIYADHLAKIAEVVDKILDPQPGPDGAVKGMDFAEARLQLKDSLTEIGYDPGAVRGTIEDLSSDQRLNLILKTNVELAQGAGRYEQGQDQTVLDLWPAQELFRAEERKEPRDWLARWQAAGGELFEGRMIALKSDPIWVEISAFGLPYPPFDFNSGMDVMDIERDEAIGLGLMNDGHTVLPEPRGFGTSQASVANVPEDIRAALLDNLGSDYKIEGGVLMAR